jgi:hypothetical protein
MRMRGPEKGVPVHHKSSKFFHPWDLPDKTRNITADARKGSNY